MSNRSSDKVEEFNTNGLALWGPNNYKNATHGEVKPKTRGWVRREQNRNEPKGESSSLLKKRTAREEDDANMESEEVKKKNG